MINKCFLVDGNGVFHNSYFRLRENPSQEEAENAFIESIMFPIRECSATHIAVCYDCFSQGKPRRRNVLLPSYKQNRPPKPPGLSEAMAGSRNKIAAMGIPIIQIEGYEADDVIATLAARVSHRAITYIYSKDKDLAQCVTSDRIFMFYEYKNTPLICGESWVKDHYGVEPRQILDFLALKGDEADNIPGVPSIGTKTAQALLTEFGTLDRVLIEAFKEPLKEGKKWESLRSNWKDAILSRELARLPLDVSIDLKFDDMAVPADLVGDDLHGLDRKILERQAKNAADLGIDLSTVKTTELYTEENEYL